MTRLIKRGINGANKFSCVRHTQYCGKRACREPGFKGKLASSRNP